MRVGIVGTGYVGLVTGTCLAELGVDMVCIDKDAAKIENLKNGIIPIYEPGLKELVLKQIENGTMTFSTNLSEAAKDLDVVFIAVGTPTAADGLSADLSYVMAVARQLAPVLKEGAVVVTKSTVPVGTSQKITQEILSVNPNAVFEAASNPEFLREGCAVDDFMNPERVVVGVRTKGAADIMRKVYSCFEERDIPVLVTTPETSEMIKYACNAFLATKITFINEIARLCEKCNGNVDDVAVAMGLDSRIGPKFLNAGPGFGGSCFPKDTGALVQTGRDHGSRVRIVESVITANREIQERLVARVINACGGSVEGKAIAVLGLAFKANTDDMRDAVSLLLVPALQRAGAVIKACDPIAQANAEKLFEGVTYLDDAYETVEGAAATVILTEDQAFKALDMQKMADLMTSPVLVDFRNLYTLEQMQDAPVQYLSLGRPVVGDGVDEAAPIEIREAAA